MSTETRIPYLRVCFRFLGVFEVGGKSDAVEQGSCFSTACGLKSRITKKQSFTPRYYQSEILIFKGRETHQSGVLSTRLTRKKTTEVDEGARDGCSVVLLLAGPGASRIGA